MPPPRNISWYVDDDFLERQKANLVEDLEAGGGGGGGGGGVRVSLQLPTAVFFIRHASLARGGEGPGEFARGGKRSKSSLGNRVDSSSSSSSSAFGVESARIRVTLKISGFDSVASAVVDVIAAASDADIHRRGAATSSSSSSSSSTFLERIWRLEDVEGKVLVCVAAAIFSALLVVFVALLLCGGGREHAQSDRKNFSE